ncbi:hypothetical protein PUNSTDRAFT_132408 [Punctularia strigosozonata HHB-11173 SS5]|uniref:uncharacterized protein n=1 Tax=Punctularia strigosozonata (strain HHB-11173) TaxID=741275 RepID=UPI0004417319|nr:uncharacterized protein PUNSTDRAFT_132408 [Punctularia strigosozonata HHB-11173 SS5]EIN10316.1 hypothetical protein PUNSTDRAFT_132408 [Punctularia strigosozonata HHB-11173 SS5]
MVVADDVASAALQAFSLQSFAPPSGQFTILASFVLSRGAQIKAISLGTGTKCLPTARYPRRGEALRDSHAEVLARRGAVRWLLEEAVRMCSEGYTSDWIERTPADYDEPFKLRSGASLNLYISTPPCGDASMRYLAAFQDAEIAALKDSTAWPALAQGSSARGRDNYALLGALRTKPGRADSPPTACMSCSDKIAAWNVLGVQGALGSSLYRPVYLERVVIGGVPEALRAVVGEDCQRAFYRRVGDARGLLLPEVYAVHAPAVAFTSLAFPHSRPMPVVPDASAVGGGGFCNDSLCWVADSPHGREVLINGMRRGVPPKHRFKPKFRPMLSKIAMFDLYQHASPSLRRLPSDRPQPHPTFHRTYRDAKDACVTYQAAKAMLRGPAGPFAGWVVSGKEWDRFGPDGEYVEVEDEREGRAHHAVRGKGGAGQVEDEG